MSRVISNLTKINIDPNHKKLAFDGRGVFLPPKLPNGLRLDDFVIRRSTTPMSFTTGGTIETTINITGPFYAEWNDFHPIVIFSESDPTTYASGVMLNYIFDKTTNTATMMVNLSSQHGDGSTKSDWCVGTNLELGSIFVNPTNGTLNIVVEADSTIDAIARTSTNVAAGVVAIGKDTDSSFIRKTSSGITIDDVNRIAFIPATATTPSITFVGSETSGFYSPDVDSIGVTVDETETVLFEKTATTVRNSLVVEGDLEATAVYADEAFVDELTFEDVVLSQPSPLELSIHAANPLTLTVAGTVNADSYEIGDSLSVVSSPTDTLISHNGEVKLSISDTGVRVNDLQITETIGFEDITLSQTGSSEFVISVNGIPKFEVGSVYSTSYGQFVIHGDLELGSAIQFDSVRVEQFASDSLTFSVNGFGKLEVTSTGAIVDGDLTVTGKLVRDVQVVEFAGNGTTGPYPLSFQPSHRNNILVDIDGILQRPSTYTVVGSTISFTTAKSAVQLVCVRLI